MNPCSPWPNLWTMHLFVYGTLRRSAAHPMHRLLLPATFVGPARFQGRLYDLGSYPGAVASAQPTDFVRGEVYRLHEPATTLATLDRYEGCTADDPAPHEYVRTCADVWLEPGADSLAAQIYLFNRPTAHLTQIEPGDYLAWLARRSVPPAGR